MRATWLKYRGSVSSAAYESIRLSIAVVLVSCFVLRGWNIAVGCYIDKWVNISSNFNKTAKIRGTCQAKTKRLLVIPELLLRCTCSLFCEVLFRCPMARSKPKYAVHEAVQTATSVLCMF